MGFGKAVRSGFSHYFDFSGRASRPAYWWWFLFQIIVGVIAAVFGFAVAGEQGANGAAAIVTLVLLIPTLAVSVRRLHDTNRSGWWLLLSVVPLVGLIVMIGFMATAGTPGPNRFGGQPPE